VKATGDAADREVAELYAATGRRVITSLMVAGASGAQAEDLVQEAYARLIPRWGSSGSEPTAAMRGNTLTLRGGDAIVTFVRTPAGLPYGSRLPDLPPW
jgi:hypothetical protein